MEFKVVKIPWFLEITATQPSNSCHFNKPPTSMVIPCNENAKMQLTYIHKPLQKRLGSLGHVQQLPAGQEMMKWIDSFVTALCWALLQNSTNMYSSFSQISRHCIIGITGLTMWKQKIQQQNITSVSIEHRPSAIWFWCSPLWDMCQIYLEDLRSTYDHALLILNKWSKSKIEVLQEQKTI